MPLKCMLLKKLKKIPDRSETKSKRKAEWSCLHSYGKSPIAPEIFSSSFVPVQEGCWANLPEELLHDIIKRIEASQSSWPGRRDVVACASVCRSWRETTKEVVKPLEQCGLFTFPDSLKQPGPRDSPVQCYIKRERGMFYLYLGLSPVLSGNASKLLLAARRIRRATKTDYLISLTTDGISRDKNTCIGKLRSNFLGTKFTVYDTHHPCDHAIDSSNQIKGTDYSNHGCLNIANISYELNVLRNRGPRKMQCIMHSIPTSSIEQVGTPPNALPPTNAAALEDLLDQQCPPIPVSKAKGPLKFGSGIVAKSPPSFHNIRDPLVLKNKAPRWHEQLQCWCLNFKGRVTVASVKNFQLVAAASEPSEAQSVTAAEQEKVVLQFGKIGKDIFTMDYAYPLSAFQAFAICLSSFDTKPTGD